MCRQSIWLDYLSDCSPLPLLLIFTSGLTLLPTALATPFIQNCSVSELNALEFPLSDHYLISFNISDCPSPSSLSTRLPSIIRYRPLFARCLYRLYRYCCCQLQHSSVYHSGFILSIVPVRCLPLNLQPWLTHSICHPHLCSQAAEHLWKKTWKLDTLVPPPSPSCAATSVPTHFGRKFIEHTGENSAFVSFSILFKNILQPFYSPYA